MNLLNKNKWVNSGLLDNTENERKDDLIKLLNQVYKLEDNNKPYFTLLYPVIVRIFNIKNINIDDLNGIIEEVKEGYKNIDYSNSYNNIDAEADFVKTYVENKIKSYG